MRLLPQIFNQCQPGLSRPTATPMPTLSTAVQVQNSSGVPGFQASADLFGGANALNQSMQVLK
jgi:hypothetical protein